MTGRQRIEKAAEAAGYTDRPDPATPIAAEWRRYERGPRWITVSYNVPGMVMGAWTADERIWSGAARKAEWVIAFLASAGSLRDADPEGR